MLDYSAEFVRFVFYGYIIGFVSAFSGYGLGLVISLLKKVAH